MNERVTPDGRYFVVRGRLWRRAIPTYLRKNATLWCASSWPRSARSRRRSSPATPEELALARKAVDTAKIALGERGPVWWTDGAPDLNRHKVSGSVYAEWWASGEKR